MWNKILILLGLKKKRDKKICVYYHGAILESVKYDLVYTEFAKEKKIPENKKGTTFRFRY